MKQIQCASGHFYDPDENTRCPHCPVQGLDLGSVKPEVRVTPVQGGLGGRSPAVPGGHRKTIAIWPGQGTTPSRVQNLDPVVGWLVAVEGPARGRDFRIRWGNNPIGRRPDQAISIAEDEAVHGEDHAFVIYEPRSNRFLLRAGTQRGLVYVDENLVVEPVSLEAYSVIRVGTSSLVFVPLCGDRFQWSLDTAAQKT